MIKSAVGLIVCFCAYACPALANGDSHAAGSYAAALYKQGLYFECIDELRKERLYFGRDAASEEYLVSCCLYMAGQYRTAALRLSGDSSYAGRLLLSKTHTSIGAYDAGYAAAADLFYEGRQAKERYLILTSRIEPLLAADMRDAAIGELAAYKKSYDDDVALAPLEAKLNENIPRRSIGLTVAASAIIPGLGQAICGRFGAAAISLATVLGSAIGGAVLVNKGEHRLAAGAFFFCGLFYAGNLYGAYNSAADFNIRHKRAYLNDFKQNYVPAYDPAAGWFDMDGLR